MRSALYASYNGTSASATSHIPANCDFLEALTGLSTIRAYREEAGSRRIGVLLETDLHSGSVHQ
jgi:hypothetical protein